MLPSADATSAGLKTRLEGDGGHAYVWLDQAAPSDGGFQATVFEVPPPLTAFAPSDRLHVSIDAVVDWMVIDSDTMYGG